MIPTWNEYIWFLAGCLAGGLAIWLSWWYSDYKKNHVKR